MFGLKLGNSDIVHNIGKYPALTHNQIAIISQLLCLIVIAYQNATYYITLRMWIYTSLSVCNLFMLFCKGTRLLSAGKTKLKVVSTYFQLCRMITLFGSPLIMLPQMKEITLLRVLVSLGFFFFGSSIQMVSDIQKQCARVYGQPKLVTDGMFARTRYPQAFGAFLRYSSFIILGEHIIIFMCVGYISYLLMLEIQLRSERLEKKQGYQEYQKHANAFFPKVFASNIMNAAVFCVIIIALVFQHLYGSSALTKVTPSQL